MILGNPLHHAFRISGCENLLIIRLYPLLMMMVLPLYELVDLLDQLT